MGTTPGGLPYPEPTAFVTDGADAIKALAQKLDTQGTYVPVMGVVTLGNGTLTGKTWQNGVMLHIENNLTFGSSTTIGGPPVVVSLPTTPNVPNNTTIGLWTAYDSSASSVRSGFIVRSGSTAILRNADGTSLSGTVPWTWGTGDQILMSLDYPIANPA